MVVETAISETKRFASREEAGGLRGHVERGWAAFRGGV